MGGGVRNRAGAFWESCGTYRQGEAERNPREPGTGEVRLARLLLSVGRFREAEKSALESHKWDGKNLHQSCT